MVVGMRFNAPARARRRSLQGRVHEGLAHVVAVHGVEPERSTPEPSLQGMHGRDDAVRRARRVREDRPPRKMSRWFTP